MSEEQKEMLLSLFASNDYPITYTDGSHGRGMGYSDFEKMLSQFCKQEVKS